MPSVAQRDRCDRFLASSYPAISIVSPGATVIGHAYSQPRGIRTDPARREPFVSPGWLVEPFAPALRPGCTNVYVVKEWAAHE